MVANMWKNEISPPAKRSRVAAPWNIVYGGNDEKRGGKRKNKASGDPTRWCWVCTGWCKSRFTVVSTQNTDFILVLLIIFFSI